MVSFGIERYECLQLGVPKTEDESRRQVLLTPRKLSQHIRHETKYLLRIIFWFDIKVEGDLQKSPSVLLRRGQTSGKGTSRESSGR